MKKLILRLVRPGFALIEGYPILRNIGITVVVAVALIAGTKYGISTVFHSDAAAWEKALWVGLGIICDLFGPLLIARSWLVHPKQIFPDLPAPNPQKKRPPELDDPIWKLIVQHEARSRSSMVN